MSGWYIIESGPRSRVRIVAHYATEVQAAAAYARLEQPMPRRRTAKKVRTRRKRKEYLVISAAEYIALLRSD